jgi:hypothetical protein
MKEMQRPDATNIGTPLGSPVLGRPSKNLEIKQVSSGQSGRIRAPDFDYHLPPNKRYRAGRRQHSLIQRRSHKQQPDRYQGLCHCSAHAWAVLTRGYVTLVSPEDAHHLQGRKWHAQICGKSPLLLVYASDTARSLHRVILDEPDSDVDHKDHDGTNNRRENLRLCPQSQNSSSSRPRKNDSGFRGVECRGQWRATITCNGKSRHLGTFDTPEEAARAYDKAAIEYFGPEFATLNFPPEQSNSSGPPGRRGRT